MSEINFSVPEGVKAEMRRGLKWHEEGHSGDGLVPATVSWARRMAGGDPISRDKVVKMRAWLKRHEVDKQGQGFKPGERGFPSPGRVSWALWGGDPAVTWSEKLVKKIREGEPMSEGLTGIKYLMSIAGTEPILLAPSGRKVKAKKPKAAGQSVVDDIDAEEALDNVATVSALQAADRLKNDFLVAAQAKSTGTVLEAAAIFETAMETARTLSPGKDLVQAQRDANTIFGLGRMQEARAEDAQFGIRSAMLESATCDVCLSKDGARFPIEELDEYSTPDPDCLGGDQCNCIVIFVKA